MRFRLARIMLTTTIALASLFDLGLRVVELLITEDSNTMSATLILSGKEAYLYEPIDDVFGGNRLERLERTEAVELLLTGKRQGSEPNADGGRAKHSYGDC